MELTAAATDRELLQRHRPCLLWDSQDDYRALSAKSIVVNRGNLLLRGDHVLAGANGEGGRRLSLELLADEASAEPKGDRLAEAPAPQAASLRMQRDSRYSNRVYGRCRRTEDGIWLQYWLWLYYNPKALLGFGRHEGDWELIQIRLDPLTHEPVAATYSQHGHGEHKEGEDFGDIEWRSCDGGCAHPVVYVAPFSHASYFEAGTHIRLPITDNPDGTFFDGLPTVEVFGAWNRWQGRWGASNRLLSVSPRSPRNQPNQWIPWRFQRRAKRRKPRESRLLWKLGRRTFPRTPAIDSAALHGDTVVVRWRTPPAPWWRGARWVLLTAHSQEPRPRLLAKRVVRAAGSGETRIPVSERPLPALEVRASSFNWLRQRSDASAAHLAAAEKEPDRGAPRARDDWSQRIWRWFSVKVLRSLVDDGAATVEELRRRKIDVLDLALDAVELTAVLDHARRTGLIEPLGQDGRPDGTTIRATEWIPSERGRFRVLGPVRWALTGVSAIPSALLLGLFSILLKEPVEDLLHSDPVVAAVIALVAVEILVLSLISAHRYFSGASARTIARAWSRHAVELPELNRWYQGRSNAQVLASVVGSALLMGVVAGVAPLAVASGAVVLAVLAQVAVVARMGTYTQLTAEARARREGTPARLS